MTKKDIKELGYWVTTPNESYHRAKYAIYLWAFGYFRYPRTVLEIGPGPLGGILSLLNRSERRVGIDPLAKEYVSNGLLPDDTNIVMVPSYFETWLTDEKFDAIFSIDSLDHGEMGFHLIPKIASLLNPGGRFYLHVHLRTADRLDKIHDHPLAIGQLNIELAKTDLIEVRRDFYSSDIDGAFDCKALVGVWGKPLCPR